MKFIVTRVWRVYTFCMTIPDRFYPFSENIDGEKVRWQAAYNQALARVQEEYGYGHYGPLLITYRGLFHVLGAILFIFFSVLISHDIFGSDGALYLLFAFLAAGIFYSELVVQKHHMGQRIFHAFIDWFSWVVPMVIYVYVHTHNINLSELLVALADKLS